MSTLDTIGIALACILGVISIVLYCVIMHKEEVRKEDFEYMQEQINWLAKQLTPTTRNENDSHTYDVLWQDGQYEIVNLRDIHEEVYHLGTMHDTKKLANYEVWCTKSETEKLEKKYKEEWEKHNGI